MADGEHLAYDGADETERTAFEVEEVFPVEKVREFEYERHALSGDGGESRATDAPAESEDEKRIEADDDEHGRKHDAHRFFRIAGRTQNFVHSHEDMGYDVARQDDAHEVAGVGDGLVACAEEVENVVEEDEPQRGEGESYHHVQHDGVAEYQECPLFVALSQTYGDERGGSDAYQRPEGRHEVHQRHGDGQPADGHRSDAVAYEDAVDDVVER